MSDQCTICDLYRLADGWIAESDKHAIDYGTRDTLRECASEITEKLPPRGHAFHAYGVRIRIEETA